MVEPPCIQVVTTTATKAEADRIAQALVARHLAACVQVWGPIESTYRWQGAVETSQEWLCVAKTLAAGYAAVEAAIRELHTYEVPEILAFPVAAGSRSYLDWLASEVSAPPQAATSMAMLYSFYVTIHALPEQAVAGRETRLPGGIVRTLTIERERLAETTLDCSFETARTRLELLERMFCEADGSFVWVSGEGQPKWQLDGNLYDRNERLLFVDLKGTCGSDQFDRLLAALGWPETKLMFQLTREAVFLGEAEFRRYAALPRIGLSDCPELTFPAGATSNSLHPHPAPLPRERGV